MFYVITYQMRGDMQHVERGSLVETASNRITRQIRLDLATGVYQPGMRLKIRDLADRFGTSMMPVREALKQLEGDGVVELFSQKGAIIRQLDIKYISDVYDLRWALEAVLVDRCVKNASDADIDGIEKLQKEHEDAAVTGDIGELLRTNEKFHSRIRELSNNAEAYRVSSQGWELINGFRARVGLGEKRIEQIVQDHRDLVAAIRDRDSPRAVRIAQLHGELAKENLVKLLSEIAV